MDPSLTLPGVSDFMNWVKTGLWFSQLHQAVLYHFMPYSRILEHFQSTCFKNSWTII